MSAISTNRCADLFKTKMTYLTGREKMAVHRRGVQALPLTTQEMV